MPGSTGTTRTTRTLSRTRGTGGTARLPAASPVTFATASPRTP